MRNHESIRRWEKYKQDYLELVQRLPAFSKELKHPIMVPIGSKALMKGSMVHTNEILISLGEGWFIKDSAERAVAICNRRIASNSL
jgi:prefoldin subunit 5